MKFTKVKTIAAQKFELETGTEYFLKVDSLPRTVHIPAETKDGKEVRPASNVQAIMVTDLQTGQTGELMLTHVLENSLTDGYPDGYNGKIFRIVKGEKLRGKDYFPMQIDEVEIEAENEEPTTAKNKK